MSFSATRLDHLADSVPRPSALTLWLPVVYVFPWNSLPWGVPEALKRWPKTPYSLPSWPWLLQTTTVTGVYADKWSGPRVTWTRRRCRGGELRVFLYSGLKTHAEGQHDYPQFLADWSKVLTERGGLSR